MEAMIKRIIDMDKKAREITEDAQKEKLDSEKEIAENARKMRENYLEKAATVFSSTRKPSAPPRNRTGSGRTPITLNSFAGWRRFSPPAGES